MAVKSQKGSKPRRSSSRKSSKHHSKSKTPRSPRARAAIREAEEIEGLLGRLYSTQPDDWDVRNALLESHLKIKHLNSFGKQLVIRMFRSSDRFWGYKVDFDSHLLQSGVLFLTGTLCESFDYMNTSPMLGLTVLDIGCGALSLYTEPDQDQDLLTQFYSDRPPIAAEMLQMLGAKTYGIDPRENCTADYDYQVAYKHFSVDFPEIQEWLQSLKQTFDVLSCINLFSRQSFLLDHQTPEDIADFFKDLRRSLAPNGLLYTAPPVMPSSPENRCTNRRIFTRAGFRILYEGYFLILEPAK